MPPLSSRRLEALVPLVKPKRNQHSKDLGPSVQFSELDMEVMRRLMEQETATSIKAGTGLTIHAYDKIITSPQFQAEYERQCVVADRGIRSRLDRLSTEAIDVVRSVMRTAISPGIRLKAATEILDRSGYVKVEKRINLNMDAEAVIRELNRLGTTDVPELRDIGDTPYNTELNTDVSPEPEEALYESPSVVPEIIAPEAPAFVVPTRRLGLGRKPQDGDSIVEENIYEAVAQKVEASE